MKKQILITVILAYCLTKYCLKHAQEERILKAEWKERMRGREVLQVRIGRIPD